MAYDPSDEAEEASNLLALARQTHEAHVAAAKRKADEIVSRAENEAATILENSRSEFEWLQAQIAKHRDFEQRYRDALKNYLGDLLEEINVEDEFIINAPEAVAEPSAFSEVDEDEAIEAAAAAEYEAAQAVVEEVVVEVAPEPEYVAPEPEYAPADYAPVEEVYAPVEEVEVAPEPEYAPEHAFEEVDEAANYSYEPVINDEYEEAPVPSYPSAYVPEEPAPVQGYAADVYDAAPADLPEVPETIDSFGSDAEEVLVFDNEVAVGDLENDYEVAAPAAPFDELFPSTSSNDLADSVADIVAAEEEAAREEDLFFTPRPAVAEEAPTEEVDKKLKGFFGFKK